MTQQDDITQRVLTAEHHLNELMRLTQPWPNATIPCATVRSHVEQALSKLRAPVADERAAFDDFIYERVCSEQPYSHFDVWQARAALASAPVAESTDRAMLQSVLQDLEKSESVCPRCGHSDSCADMDVAHMIRDHLKGDASAPVAGEQIIAWDVQDTGLGRRYTTYNPKVAEDLMNLGENVRPLVYASALPPANAAPQASAEDVRNAALDALEAARRFIRNGIEFGYIRMPDADKPDPAHRTPGMIDAAIRALKQLQADKAARCTCPSGDGSLRNPCAAHPAKASGNGGKEWSDS